MAYSFKQKVEPIDARIRLILRDYPSGAGILYELLQNADDAGASIFEVALVPPNPDAVNGFKLAPEECDNAQDWLLPLLASTSSSLVVYNDAGFRPDDWVAIQNIGRSSKKAKPGVIGRFGIGFNSVFHLGDCVLIASGSKLGVLFPALADSPDGTGFQQEISLLWKKAPGLLTPLIGVAGFRQGDTELKGTAVRIILRNKPSCLSKEVPQTANIRSYFDVLQKLAPLLLSGVRCVTEIAVNHYSDDGSQRIFSATLTKSPELDETRGAYRLFVDSLSAKSSMDDVLEALRRTPSPFQVKCCMTQLTLWRKESGSRTYIGAFASCIGGNNPKTTQFAKLHAEDLRVFPFACICSPWFDAISNEPLPLANAPSIMCGLPLADEIWRPELPIIVNGVFSVGSNRRTLTLKSASEQYTTAIQATWNEMIFSDTVALAYLELLKMAKGHEKLQIQMKEGSLWPASNPSRTLLSMMVRSLLQQCVTLPLLFTPSYPAQWVTPTQAMFREGTLCDNVELLAAALDVMGLPVVKFDIASPLARDFITILQTPAKPNPLQVMTPTLFFSNLLPLLPKLGEPLRTTAIVHCIARRLEFPSLRVLSALSRLRIFRNISGEDRYPSELCLPTPQIMALVESSQLARSIFAHPDFRDMDMSVLAELGFCDKLSPAQLISLATELAKAKHTKTLAVCTKESTRLVQYILDVYKTSQPPADFSALAKIPFLPVIAQRPEKWPRECPWPSEQVAHTESRQLVAPNGCVPFRYAYVAGLCFPVVSDEMLPKHFLQQMGLPELPLVETAYRQITELEKTRQALYQPRRAQLSSAIQNFFEDIQLIIMKEYLPSQGNVASVILDLFSRIFLSVERGFQPLSCFSINGPDIGTSLWKWPDYLHPCKERAKRMLNIPMDFTGHQLLSVVESFQKDVGVVKSGAEVKQLLDVLDALATSNFIIDPMRGQHLVVPEDESHRILRVNEARIFDCKFNMQFPEIRSQHASLFVNVVDRQISPNTFPLLLSFGATSLQKSVAETFQVNDVTFSLKEDITHRIGSLLSDYPIEQALIPELVQNADDSGATELILVLDEASYGSINLPDEGLSTLNGPAMLVYNNSRFEAKDFDAIQNLSTSSKRSDPTMCGQFGVGFACVYRLTDAPEIMSGGRLAVFDPIRKHFQHNNGGSIWTVNEQFRDMYSDLVIPFESALEGLNLSRQQIDNGSVFRLPLRKDALADKSSPWRKAVPPWQVWEWIEQCWTEIAQHLLLFTKHLRSIRIYRRSADRVLIGKVMSVHREAVRISADATPQNRVFEACPEQSIQPLLDAGRDNKAIGPPVIVQNLFKIVCSSDSGKVSEHKLLVSHYLDRSAKTLQKVEQGDFESMLGRQHVGWVAVAQPLFGSVLQDFYMFSGLPIRPLMRSDLPFHVHAQWHLDTSRSLKSSVWNDYLRDALVPVAIMSWMQCAKRSSTMLADACLLTVSTCVKDPKDWKTCCTRLKQLLCSQDASIDNRVFLRTPTLEQANSTPPANYVSLRSAIMVDKAFYSKHADGILKSMELIPFLFVEKALLSAFENLVVATPDYLLGEFWEEHVLPKNFRGLTSVPLASLQVAALRDSKAFVDFVWDVFSAHNKNKQFSSLCNKWLQLRSDGEITRVQNDGSVSVFDPKYASFFKQASLHSQLHPDFMTLKDFNPAYFGASSVSWKSMSPIIAESVAKLTANMNTTAETQMINYDPPAHGEGSVEWFQHLWALMATLFAEKQPSFEEIAQSMPGFCLLLKSGHLARLSALNDMMCGYQSSPVVALFQKFKLGFFEPRFELPPAMNVVMERKAILMNENGMPGTKEGYLRLLNRLVTNESLEKISKSWHGDVQVLLAWVRESLRYFQSVAANALPLIKQLPIFSCADKKVRSLVDCSICEEVGKFPPSLPAASKVVECKSEDRALIWRLLSRNEAQSLTAIFEFLLRHVVPSVTQLEPAVRNRLLQYLLSYKPQFSTDDWNRLKTIKLFVDEAGQHRCASEFVSRRYFEPIFGKHLPPEFAYFSCQLNGLADPTGTDDLPASVLEMGAHPDFWPDILLPATQFLSQLPWSETSELEQRLLEELGRIAVKNGPLIRSVASVRFLSNQVGPFHTSMNDTPAQRRYALSELCDATNYELVWSVVPCLQSGMQVPRSFADMLNPLKVDELISHYLRCCQVSLPEQLMPVLNFLTKRLNFDTVKIIVLKSTRSVPCVPVLQGNTLRFCTPSQVFMQLANAIPPFLFPVAYDFQHYRDVWEHMFGVRKMPTLDDCVRSLKEIYLHARHDASNGQDAICDENVDVKNIQTLFAIAAPLASALHIDKLNAGVETEVWLPNKDLKFCPSTRLALAPKDIKVLQVILKDYQLLWMRLQVPENIPFLRYLGVLVPDDNQEVVIEHGAMVSSFKDEDAKLWYDVFLERCSSDEFRTCLQCIQASHGRSETKTLPDAVMKVNPLFKVLSSPPQIVEHLRGSTLATVGSVKTVVSECSLQCVLSATTTSSQDDVPQLKLLVNANFTREQVGPFVDQLVNGVITHQHWNEFCGSYLRELFLGDEEDMLSKLPESCRAWNDMAQLYQSSRVPGTVCNDRDVEMVIHDVNVVINVGDTVVYQETDHFLIYAEVKKVMREHFPQNHDVVLNVGRDKTITVNDAFVYRIIRAGNRSHEPSRPPQQVAVATAGDQDIPAETVEETTYASEIDVLIAMMKEMLVIFAEPDAKLHEQLFRRLQRKYHPDKFGHPQATQIFQRLRQYMNKGAAWVREEYRRATDPTSAKSSEPQPAPQEWKKNNADEDNDASSAGFRQQWEDIFPGRFAHNRQRRRRHQQQQQQQYRPRNFDDARDPARAQFASAEEQRRVFVTLASQRLAAAQALLAQHSDSALEKLVAGVVNECYGACMAAARARMFQHPRLYETDLSMLLRLHGVTVPTALTVLGANPDQAANFSTFEDWQRLATVENAKKTVESAKLVLERLGV